MLETTWFYIWGLLWAIYFMLDGFDFGAGMLMPFLTRDEKERRALLRSIGPFWDGNEVWLVTAGGVTFAAFPGAYAVMFSTLYTPLMLILFGLIVRGASIAFREETESNAAKRLCDLGFFLGSFAPALLLGVAFANLFKGIPLTDEKTFQGNLLTLLNPYGLLGGLFFLLLFLQHGAIWLALKTAGELGERAGRAAKGLWVGVALLGVAFLVASYLMTPLYNNYLAQPALFGVFAGILGGLAASCLLIFRGQWAQAWWATSLLIVSATLFGVIGMYPALVPSGLNPDWSITIAKSASSELTLKIMLIVVLIFLPIVIAYQAWVFWLFRGKVEGTEEGY